MKKHAKASLWLLLIGVMISFAMTSCHNKDNSQTPIEAWGYIDKTGDWVIEPQFSEAGSFSESFAVAGVIIDGEKKLGYIGKSGEWKIDPQFDQAIRVKENAAVVEKGEVLGWLLIDTLNKSVNLIKLPDDATRALDFSDGLALFSGAWITSFDRKSGYIDRSGKVVIEAQFLDAAPFSEGLAAVSVDGVFYGYIDKSGKMVIEPQFREAKGFSEGLAYVSVDGSYGYIDKSGEIVVEPRYVGGFRFSEGLANVRIKSDEYASNYYYKNGYIDKTGTMVIEPVFDVAFPFSEGLAVVCYSMFDPDYDETDSSKFGYIDKTGALVIDTLYEEANPFSEGLALVRVDDKYGYIDKTGKMVIEPRFIDAKSFSEGMAAVKIKRDDCDGAK